MEKVSTAVLLVAVISTITGQGLFDCTHDGQILLEGEFKTVGNCEQVRCARGSIDREVCDAVPFGCTPIEKQRRSTQNYPDCCPQWCCGKECEQPNKQVLGSSTIRNPDSPTLAKRPTLFNTGDLSGSKTTLPSMQSSSEEDNVPIITLGGSEDSRGPSLQNRPRTTSKPNRVTRKPARVSPFTSRRPQETPKSRPFGGVSSHKPDSHRPSPDADGTACIEDGRRIKSGQSASAPGCRRLDCKDGILTTQFCREVPSGCKIVHEHKDSDFPGCCPFWNCDHGASGLPLTAGALGRSCNFEGRSIRNGQTDYADDCRRVQCTNGVLSIMFCNPTPPGCTEVNKVSRGRFPKCCPRFRC